MTALVSGPKTDGERVRDIQVSSTVNFDLWRGPGA